MKMDEWDDKSLLNYIQWIMKNLNFIIIIFLSLTMSVSIYRICDSMGAASFMNSLNRLPQIPWKIPVYSCVLYISLLLLMNSRVKLRKNVGLFFLTAILELTISVWIMWILHMNYSGIILLIVADLLTYSKKNKTKIILLGLIFILFIFADYDLMASKWNIISFRTYLSYYNVPVVNLLIGIKNVLTSINLLLFALFMILLIRIQTHENERINLLNQQLQEANLQLEEYAKKTEKMTETRERNRLAREIHDTLGHALTGIIAGIDACMAMIDIAPEAVKKQMVTIGEVARNGMTDVRRSVNALRPDVLERLNLLEALQQMISEITATTSTEILLKNKIEHLKFSEDEEDVIYRIIQESVTNAIRHGKAKEIQIELSMEYNVLTITVIDNGCGCKDIKNGFGLQHMRERLGMLQGTLEIAGSNGFKVIARIPIRWGEEYD